MNIATYLVLVYSILPACLSAAAQLALVPLRAPLWGVCPYACLAAWTEALRSHCLRTPAHTQTHTNTHTLTLAVVIRCSAAHQGQTTDTRDDIRCQGTHHSKERTGVHRAPCSRGCVRVCQRACVCICVRSQAHTLFTPPRAWPRFLSTAALNSSSSSLSSSSAIPKVPVFTHTDVQASLHTDRDSKPTHGHTRTHTHTYIHTHTCTHAHEPGGFEAYTHTHTRERTLYART